MNVIINFLSSETLPGEVIASYYVGNDERGFHSQYRLLTNGETQVRHGESLEWVTL